MRGDFEVARAESRIAYGYAYYPTLTIERGPINSVSRVEFF